MKSKQPEVYWSVLPDVTIGDYAFMASLAVASRAGNLGYAYIVPTRQRTDVARNRLCSAFRANAADPNDVLVMLDCDHTHPHNIIEKLVDHEPDKGVVGALAFRRGEPYFPCLFLRGKDGKIYQPLQYTGGLMECVIVGTGAIAIRRWVLDKLADKGFPAPFLYQYDATMIDSGEYESEDASFGKLCERFSISHWCDTSLVTPHLITTAIDDQLWARRAEQIIQRQQATIETLPLQAAGG